MKFKKFIDDLFGRDPEQNLEDDDKSKKPEVKDPEQKLGIVEDTADFYVEKSVLEQIVADAVANAEKADADSVQENPENYVAFPPNWGQKAMSAVFDAIQGAGSQAMAADPDADPNADPADDKKPEDQKLSTDEFVTHSDMKEVISETVNEMLKRFSPIEDQLQELKLELETPSRKPTKTTPNDKSGKNEPFSMTKLVEEGLEK